jgi:hypothetical protein
MNTDPRNIDLFGRKVINRQGGEQMRLFHEPITISRPTPERIGSKNATDPRHTSPMFILENISTKESR